MTGLIVVGNRIFLLSSFGDEKKVKIGLTKMGMRSKTEDLLKKGLTIIYPNYRHENRKGGLTGFSALSPMRLGPIKANGIVYKTLESFHQFNKVYANEYNNEKKEIKEDFFKQLKIGANQEPGKVWRHKYGKTKVEHIKNLKKILPKGPFTPLFSYHEGKTYSYLESRYFYCTYYESLVKETKEYKRLVKLVKEGLSVNICGYDAPDCDKITHSFLLECYKSPKRPFGHELALASLLYQELYNIKPPWYT